MLDNVSQQECSLNMTNSRIHLLTMISFIIFSTVFPLLSPLNYQDQEEWCGGRCYFEPGEITLKRLEKWPKDCDDVCSVIVITSNCDASYSELKEIFQELRYFKGGLVINGTSFENLSFFPANVNWELETEHLIITDNEQLNNIETVVNMCTTGYIQIVNNPKLNASAVCDIECFDKRFTQISGNLGNCDCTGGTVDSTTIIRYNDCKYISGDLTITNVDDRSYLSALSDIRYIAGALEITRTNLTSLSFLGNLERISMNIFNYKYKKREDTVILNIHDNPKLKRLEMFALGFVESFDRATVNLENLNWDFCLSLHEVFIFSYRRARVKNMEARFCEEVFQDFNGQPLCTFKSMKELDNNCGYISGDVLMDSGDEEYVGKLRKVRRVFGTITVRNTSLTNGTFMRKLESVESLNNLVPIVQLIGNTNLKNLKFPQLTLFLSNGNNQVILDDNHPDIFESVEDCWKFQETTDTNVLINGQPCGPEKNHSSFFGHFSSVGLALLFLRFVFSLNLKL